MRRLSFADIPPLILQSCVLHHDDLRLTICALCLLAPFPRDSGPFAHRRFSSIGKRFLEEKTRSIDQNPLQLCPAGTPFLGISDDLQGPFRLISDIALGGSTVYFFLNLP
jgi:hypothetical protein